MWPAGRVEQDPLGAGVEVGLAAGDEGGRLDPRLGAGDGRQAEALPGWPVEPGDDVRGFVTGQLDDVRVQAGDDLGQALERRIGGDRHDPGLPGTGSPGEAGQRDRLGQAELTGRARHEVQADRIGARAQGGPHPGRVGHPADLHERGPVGGGDIVGQPAGGGEASGRGGRVGGPHQGLPDEDGIEAEGAPAGHRRRVAHPGLGDDEPVGRYELAQPDGPLWIDGQGPQVAVVQADQPGRRGEGAVDLALVVRLDQRLEADRPGGRDEARQAGRRMEAGQEQDEVGPGGAQERQLPAIDDELLGQDRDADGRPNRAQVVDRAAEPVRLAQDRDDRRPARRVAPRPGDRVVGRGNDPACRG